MTGKNKSFIGYSHLEAIIFYDERRIIYIKNTGMYIEKNKRGREREWVREREDRRVDTIYIINYQSRTTTSKFLIIIPLNKCSTAISYLQLSNVRADVVLTWLF